jgi:hypothetical protein
MVCFQTKNPNLSILPILQWKMLVYFVAIRSILRPFGIFYGHLEYFSRFGVLYEEKSGNPAPQPDRYLELDRREIPEKEK